MQRVVVLALRKSFIVKLTLLTMTVAVAIAGSVMLFNPTILAIVSEDPGLDALLSKNAVAAFGPWVRDT